MFQTLSLYVGQVLIYLIILGLFIIGVIYLVKWINGFKKKYVILNTDVQIFSPTSMNKSKYMVLCNSRLNIIPTITHIDMKLFREFQRIAEWFIYNDISIVAIKESFVDDKQITISITDGTSYCITFENFLLDNHNNKTIVFVNHSTLIKLISL